MYNIIKNATLEFEKNGRSDEFVKMEDKIIGIGKTIQVYFFARYAKGADVNRLFRFMLKHATLKESFAFAYYVKGVEKVDGKETVVYPDVTKFLNKLVRSRSARLQEIAVIDNELQKQIDLNEKMHGLDEFCGDGLLGTISRNNYWKEKNQKKNELKYRIDKIDFWIQKTLQIAKSQGKLEDVKDTINMLNIDANDIKLNKEDIDVDTIIEKAKNELSTNGFSLKYKGIEERMKYSILTGDFRAVVFIKNLRNYIDVKDFEKNILLSGDYFNMFMFAKGVKGANKKLMLEAVKLCGLDYWEIEKDLMEEKRYRRRTKDEESIDDFNYNEEAYRGYRYEIDHCVKNLEYTLEEERKMPDIKKK